MLQNDKIMWNIKLKCVALDSFYHFMHGLASGSSGSTLNISLCVYSRLQFGFNHHFDDIASFKFNPIIMICLICFL